MSEKPKKLIVSPSSITPEETEALAQNLSEYVSFVVTIRGTLTAMFLSRQQLAGREGLTDEILPMCAEIDKALKGHELGVCIEALHYMIDEAHAKAQQHLSSFNKQAGEKPDEKREKMEGLDYYA